MFAKKCDRCGEFYTVTDKDATSILTLTLTKKRFPFLEAYTEDVDLCPKCDKDLKKWLNQKCVPQSNPNEENEE